VTKLNCDRKEVVAMYKVSDPLRIDRDRFLQTGRDTKCVKSNGANALGKYLGEQKSKKAVETGRDESRGLRSG
jgi:hypothetical protein